ncbi:MAG: hypothetical protein EOO92_26580 [Pedobacter sp.]|nr:MAG: hypothetical protein EOO92_26580 [Pedobacter sp.]
MIINRLAITSSHLNIMLKAVMTAVPGLIRDFGELEKLQVSVKNTGGFAIPFDVVVTYTDGKVDTIHKTPAVWKANQKEVVVTVNSAKKVKSISLDNGIYMDATPADNVWLAK